MAEMGTEVTAESLRAHAEQATGTMRRALYAWADSMERATPGRTFWAARWGDGPSWDSAASDLRVVYEKAANAVLAAHGTPTLTPVGEHPVPGTRGLLPVKMRDGEWQYKTEDGVVFGVSFAESCGILADPRPDGAHV